MYVVITWSYSLSLSLPTNIVDFGGLEFSCP